MKKLSQTTLFILCFMIVTNLLAQESKPENSLKNFYIKPYGGFIGIQNTTPTFQQDNTSTKIEVETGFGINTGISLGYSFSENFFAEIGWEYKTNEISVKNNDLKTNGDYASNFIFLNGLYNLNTKGNFIPYVGLGTALIQEIDIDLSTNGNTSFSNSGNFGFQGIIGLDFNFSERWALNWEAKYISFGSLELDNEMNDSSISNIKYNPFIFNIGIKYRF